MQNFNSDFQVCVQNHASNHIYSVSWIRSWLAGCKTLQTVHTGMYTAHCLQSVANVHWELASNTPASVGHACTRLCHKYSADLRQHADLASQCQWGELAAVFRSLWVTVRSGCAESCMHQIYSQHCINPNPGSDSRFDLNLTWQAQLFKKFYKSWVTSLHLLGLSIVVDANKYPYNIKASKSSAVNKATSNWEVSALHSSGVWIQFEITFLGDTQAHLDSMAGPSDAGLDDIISRLIRMTVSGGLFEDEEIVESEPNRAEAGPSNQATHGGNVAQHVQVHFTEAGTSNQANNGGNIAQHVQPHSAEARTSNQANNGGNIAHQVPQFPQIQPPQSAQPMQVPAGDPVHLRNSRDTQRCLQSILHYWSGRIWTCL